MRNRLLVAIVGLPLIAVIIMAGGLLYQAVVAILLGTAIWELTRMMKGAGYAPSLLVSWLLAGTILASVTWPEVLGPGVSLGILLALYMSLRSFHQGNPSPLNSFSLTLGIGLYTGWLGSYFLHLRFLDAGEWWVLTVLSCIFAADTGAYVVGKAFGRHQLDPIVSPKKTWEGYFGGIAFAIFFGGLMTWFWSFNAPINAVHGLVFGVVVSILAPLGDLGVSAFKRQVGAKDASRLIPGHGGVMDRLDTMLVAGVLGYYYILWFAL